MFTIEQELEAMIAELLIRSALVVRIPTFNAFLIILGGVPLAYF